MKKLNVIILHILLIIVLISCKSFISKNGNERVNYNPYYIKVYEADSLYLTKNYVQSFNILDKLFRDYEPLNFGIYEEYETYIKLSYQLRKKTNDKILISKLVSTFGKRVDEIEQDSILNLVYKNSKLDEYQYKKLREGYLASLNMPLRDTILQIYERDQTVRTKGDATNIKKFDLDNQHKLAELIDEYGFPSLRKIGVKSLEQGKYDPIDITEVWLHMMDYNGKEKDYILKQIEKAVKEGKCNPQILSLIFDRDSHKMKKAKSEYYYGLATSNIELSKDELLEVNARRKQIGLPSFQFEKWKMKIYWGN